MLFFSGRVHDKAMHLHALATLKVVIGTTTALPDENGTVQNGGVDKDNNMTKVHTISNGHITPEQSPNKGNNQLMTYSNNKDYQQFDKKDEIQLKVNDENCPKVSVTTTNSQDPECSTSPENQEV